MQFYKYELVSIRSLPGEAFILQVKPLNKIIPQFKPGQHIKMRNPLYIRPEEEHYFSIASSSFNTTYLEFCIKIYGNWTQACSKLKETDILEISNPDGTFIWDPSCTNNVFLMGGVGVAPILSMLRTMKQQAIPVKNVLLYGSRTEDTIAFRDEIESMCNELTDSRVVHILSHITPEIKWEGYRGFITEEILKKEVNFDSKPVFFICGPPIFIGKMEQLLLSLSVEKDHIRYERIVNQPQ